MIKYSWYYINLLTFCNLCFSNCTTAQQGEVIGVRIESHLPVLASDKNSIVTNSYDVYYLGNLTLYRLTVKFDSSTQGVHVLSEDRYQYFVYAKDSAFGINFIPVADYTNSSDSVRLPVDSLIATHNNYFTTFDDEKDRRPDSSFWYAKNQLINVFNFKKTDKYPEDLSFYYWYSDKFKDIRESYSKKFDTTKGLKLFKIVILAHGANYQNANSSSTEREYLYEMKSVSLADLAIANRFFEKYRDFLHL